jgi:hypothetical protein
MAQQPYMGSGLLLPPLFEVTKSCAFVGDWSTGRATVLSILMCTPEPFGSQSGDLGEKWRQFGLSNIFIHARKVLLHAVNLRHGTDGFTSPPKEVVLGFLSPLKIHRPRSGSNPRTLGPVASTLTTSPPRYSLTIVYLNLCHSKHNTVHMHCLFFFTTCFGCVRRPLSGNYKTIK